MATIKSELDYIQEARSQLAEALITKFGVRRYDNAKDNPTLKGLWTVKEDGSADKLKRLHDWALLVTGTNVHTDASLTFKNDGKGDAAGTTFNGSVAKSISYNSIGAAASNHVHKNLIIKWGAGDTEGTNLFTYNGSTAKTINLSVPFSQLFTSFGNVDTGFKATNITATVSGVTKSFAVNWAIYAGRAQTSDKWTTARTLTIGNTGKSVDGSANVSWSLAEIGVSAAAHTHSVKINGATKTIAASNGTAVDLGNYLPLSGGTMSGNITINTDSEIRWSRNTDYSRIHFKNESDSDTDSYMGFETGDNGNEYFRFAGNNDGTVTQWMSIKADGVRASAFIGNLKGNASTATKLESSAGNAALPIYFSDGKPVACVPSSLFSTLSNSGNNLSITIAGQNRTLTVNYASNTTSTEYLNNYSISDPNTQALKDNKVKWFAQINTSSGYAGNNYGFPVGNNANGILYLGTHPGKYGHQLGFSSNGNIYHRFQNGSDFPQTANGGSWSVLLTSTNYSSILDNRYYTETEADNRFVNITGDTMTGLLVTTQGSSHSGIKVGNTYINAINGDLIFQNNRAIRFGGDSWDYNVWAGLKYVHSSKTIYLGLADGSAFTANNAQSGGKLYLPGIVNIYTGNGSNLVWHAGNDGSGSGLDADMTDGLHVHSGRNNEANKIVRTDGSGYIQAGWINTTSGDMGTTTATRVYCSNDAYIRYKTLANFSSDIAGQLYWANVKVSTTSSTATQPTFNTCYTSNWFRSTGSTGWYSETYGGGWYMTDSNYVRVYNNKRVYNDNTSQYAFYTAGGMTALGHIYSNSTSCSWLSGQNASHAALNIENATDTSAYWPWLRQTNTSSAKWFSVGTLGTSLYFIGSATSRTSNGYDYGFIMNFSNGTFSSPGDIYAPHFYENSDIRYKKVLKNLLINSNTIANLPLFDFEWIENNTIGTGTSAQAVQEILPNLVSGTDKLTLDYGVLGTIAGITACKELVAQKSEIELLKERIEQLEQQLKMINDYGRC